jgi:hypothetical protein
LPLEMGRESLEKEKKEGGEERCGELEKEIT